MKRAAVLSILGLTVLACSEQSTTAPDAGVDAGVDAGGPVSRDATVWDVGARYDAGMVVEEDAGFRDPATLLEGRQNLDNVMTYMRVRGTLTSTMPPVVIMNTGPLLGHEYLVEPLDFMLGPGGAEDPDRLLVFYDMRATGRSSFGSIESSTISIDAHVADFDNVLDWVEDFTGRAGPVDILAHGYGAAVATLYAADHPARISRMIFVAPYPSHIQEQAEWGAEVNGRLSAGERERLAQISEWNYCLRDLQRCSHDAWNIVGPTWLCRAQRELFYRMDFRYVDARAFLFFIQYELRERAFDFRPIMARVDHPVTIISGACDPIPASAAMNYASSLANSTHYPLQDSGHFPMTEAPEVFQGLVRRALTYP